MKRLTGRAAALLTGASLVATIAACGGGESSSGEPQGGGEAQDVVLTLGHAGSGNDDLRNVAALALKENVEEATDGRVQIEVHDSGTLGTAEEMVEGVQAGSLDITIEGLLILEAYTDLAGVETLPFLYEDADHFNETWSGEIGDEIKSAITDSTGYSIAGNIYRGPRHLTTKEPVVSVEELKGLTVRTPTAKTMLDTWNALGARAEGLPFTEVYSALEQGVIDGQENPLETTYFNSLHEVAPNITTTAHVYGNYHFLMSQDWLDSLDEETRVVILDAAEKAAEEASEVSAENERELVGTMESEGVTFHEMENREEWVTATEPVIESSNETVQEWVERIRES